MGGALAFQHFYRTHCHFQLDILCWDCVLEIRYICYSNQTILMCRKPFNIMYLLLTWGWMWRTLPGAMKGFQLSWLSCYLHFSLAVSWALKFCVILPLEYIKQHPKFMLNVNKVSTDNKALCSEFLVCRDKWHSMDSSDDTRATVQHLNQTQEIISMFANIIWTRPFSRLVRFSHNIPSFVGNSKR